MGTNMLIGYCRTMSGLSSGINSISLEVLCSARCMQYQYAESSTTLPWKRGNLNQPVLYCILSVSTLLSVEELFLIRSRGLLS